MSKFIENVLNGLVTANIVDSLNFLVNRTEQIIEGNHIDYQSMLDMDCLESKKNYFNNIFQCLCDEDMQWTRIIVGFTYMKIIIAKSQHDSEHYYQWSLEVNLFLFIIIIIFR